MERFIRNINLLGKEKIDLLKTKTVLIAGLGGVGGYAIEALARLNIGKLILVDFDTVEESNINRQIIALTSSIGLKKVELFKQRIKEINPECEVIIYDYFIDKDHLSFFDNKIDYVIDAIDSVESKILLMKECEEKNIPIISSMGTANKMDPTKIKITNLDKTDTDPLAKKIRMLSRKEGINLKKVKCVYSTEIPSVNEFKELPSIIFPPAVAGLYLAYECVKDLIK